MSAAGRCLAQALVAAAAGATEPGAEPAPLEGELAGPAAIKFASAARLNYTRSDKVLSDERHFVLSTFETKASYDLSSSLRAALQLRASAILAPGTRSQVDFPYAYLDWRTTAADFRIGKQILAWGKTDALNPTDIVTPRNYTTLLPFDEDERSGVWGARGTYYVTDTVAATLFFGTRFKPSTLPFASRGAQQYRFDADGAKKRQVGVRVAVTRDDIDFSVSAYHGASLLAQAERAETRAGTHTVFLRYPTIDMVGADLARNFGKFGMRIEAAAVRPVRGEATATGLRPYRYLVAGMDRTFFSDLNVNVQLFGRWTDPAPGRAGACGCVDAMGAELTGLNGLIFVQSRRRTQGMTFRVANQWMNQTLSAEVFVQHYFGDNSTYVHPMATYALSDRTRITAGAVWYGGNEGSLFGVMKKNRSVFSELRYSF
ncbi:DUF1302 family protein [Massilia sp. Se16.2.3]|uniref:DUF1302 family protein n=1 Tax=Massilia sp. Se16.2.3 TaxID=2709303 RepID=UPI001601CD85|nr:DUF1302 family protein [Massilia sp. Se16.2.3]QNA98177.1 hypothetical protein G4G31_03940 [Massilia sp. Se16.2.3]